MEVIDYCIERAFKNTKKTSIEKYHENIIENIKDEIEKAHEDIECICKMNEYSKRKYLLCKWQARGFTIIYVPEQKRTLVIS